MEDSKMKNNETTGTRSARRGIKAVKSDNLDPETLKLLKERASRFRQSVKKAVKDESLENVSGGVNIPDDENYYYFELIDRCPVCDANLFGCCEAGLVVQIDWVVCLRCGYESW